MAKRYARINFQNNVTNLGATTMNKMDKAIDDIDNEVEDINSRVTTLNNNLTYSTTSVTSDTMQNTLVRKKSNIAELVLGKVISAIANGTTITIGTLPEGYRPTIALSRVITVTTSAVLAYVTIVPSGTITFRPYANIAADTPLYQSIMFIV